MRYQDLHKVICYFNFFDIAWESYDTVIRHAVVWGTGNSLHPRFLNVHVLRADHTGALQSVGALLFDAASRLPLRGREGAWLSEVLGPFSLQGEGATLRHQAARWLAAARPCGQAFNISTHIAFRLRRNAIAVTGIEPATLCVATAVRLWWLND